VSTDVSEEHIASIFWVEKISSERNQRASRLTLNGQHGVISQKMVLFITTAVRTSSPTDIYLTKLYPYLLPVNFKSI
jgi:hypothetical protein